MDRSGSANQGRAARAVVDDDFERLFRGTYAQLVVALSLMSGQQAAEDAVQDGFVQALRHWDRVHNYDDPAAWVRRAALNRLANQRRGLTRRNRVIDHLGVTASSTHQLGDEAALVDLRSALSDLPERERTVVVLHHVAGVPVADLAADLELPEGTVKSILSRTRERLRAVLAEPAEVELAPDAPTAGGTA